MKNFTRLFIVSLFGLATIPMQGQYCIPPDFLSGPFTGITNVTLETLNKTSSLEGYMDYTSTAAPDLDQGGSHSMSMGFEHTYINSVFTDQVNARVWIDFNQDDDFDDVGEEVMSEVVDCFTGPGSWSGTINIPAGATLGNTRMRTFCDMRIADGHDAPNTCGYLNSNNSLGHHGQIEDYTVNIILGSGIQSHQASNGFQVINNGGVIGFNYTLAKSADVKLDIYTVLGQKVNSFTSGNMNAGQHSFSMNKNELNNKGIYFATLIVDGVAYTNKFVLTN